MFFGVFQIQSTRKWCRPYDLRVIQNSLDIKQWTKIFYKKSTVRKNWKVTLHVVPPKPHMQSSWDVLETFLFWISSFLNFMLNAYTKKKRLWEECCLEIVLRSLLNICFRSSVIIQSSIIEHWQRGSISWCFNLTNFMT